MLKGTTDILPTAAAALRSMLRASASLAVALAAVLAVALAGCGSDGEDVIVSGGDGTGDLRASFYITVSDGGKATVARSAGFLGDGYDRGEGYENFIDVVGNDYIFIFFDSSDRYIGMLDVESVIPVESSSVSKTYTVLGRLDAAIAKAGTVKIMALANWNHHYPAAADLKGGMTMTEIAASLYDFDPARMLPSAENLIPLYGITNPVELQFDDHGLANAGRIHLLRAYAKIEVINSPESVAPIESVTLTRYNTAGYRGPAGVTRQDDYVHGNYRDDYVNTPHIPAGVKVETNLPLQRTVTGSYIAYVPEFDNTSATATAATLSVHFAGDSIGYYDVVEFKYYQAPEHDATLKDKPFDLLRNYWYKFTLRKNRTVNVEVVLVPYAEVILNPDFGLEPPVDVDDPRFYNAVINERFGDILYYRNEKNETCLTHDLQLKVDDPSKNIDPATGWQIVRGSEPLNGHSILYYYFDPVNNLQYAPDKKTPVRLVFSWAELGYVTYLELEKKEGVTSEDGMTKYEETGVDYYHDGWNNLWYDVPPTKCYHVDKQGYIVDISNNYVLNSAKNKIKFVKINSSKYLLNASGNRIQGTDGKYIKMDGMLLSTPYPAS